MTLDGEQMRVYHSLAPPDCNEETNSRAFAVLTGAAAAAAYRMADRSDLGGTLHPAEREVWQAAASLLLRLADQHTWGAEVDAGEVREAAGELAGVL
jgi:hypothetical protein